MSVWPNLFAPGEFYVKLVLYTLPPVYVEYASPYWHLKNNPDANPLYVLTVARELGGTATYTCAIQAVDLKAHDNPPPMDLIKADAYLRKVQVMRESTAEALGEFIYSFCIGFLVCTLTTQGSTLLRAPRWSADYSYEDYVFTGLAPHWVGTKAPLVCRAVEGGDEQVARNFVWLVDILDKLFESGATIFCGSSEPVTSLQGWLSNPTFFS